MRPARRPAHAAVRPAGGADIDSLREQTQAAQSRYDAAAAKLGTARRKVAKDLGKLVTQAMQTLAMQGPLRADAVTRDAVRARQRTGRIPGGRPCRHLAAPLAKVASGGELSRISLALSVIASRARVPTLIFDEVDSGVGGAVAEVVGKLLRWASGIRCCA